jgi:hypothetical protein
MDAPERHRAIDYSHLAVHIAAAIAVIFFAVFVLWMVMSKQNSKLYEADNYVCVSQPFQLECFPRSH